MSPSRRLLLAALLLPLSLVGHACQGAETTPGAAPEKVQVEALKLANFHAPTAGVFTAGQPTQEQFARLKETDVKHVIHLRAATEKDTGWEEQKAQELGLRFVRLPIEGEKGLTLANVKQFAALLEQSGGETTLVSCGSSNRVGALFALKAYWLDGQDAATALAAGKAAGMLKLEPKVKELLAQPK